jgi:6-phosphogluconate dehydrogenase
MAAVVVVVVAVAISGSVKETRDCRPQNLTQAQRDYFGANTYERTDKPRGEFFHTVWMR